MRRYNKKKNNLYYGYYKTRFENHICITKIWDIRSSQLQQSNENVTNETAQKMFNEDTLETLLFSDSIILVTGEMNQNIAENLAAFSNKTDIETGVAMS